MKLMKTQGLKRQHPIYIESKSEFLPNLNRIQL